jgi:hypothetical protein
VASKDFETAIERVLDANGIRYRYARRRKHRAVIVEHGGRVRSFTFPSSPSDHRGPRNFAAYLRRALSLNAR